MTVVGEVNDAARRARNRGILEHEQVTGTMQTYMISQSAAGASPEQEARSMMIWCYLTALCEEVRALRREVNELRGRLPDG